MAWEIGIKDKIREQLSLVSCSLLSMIFPFLVRLSQQSDRINHEA